MNVYLNNVLKGFISRKTHVKLASYTREMANFIVTDIDTDDMPEIIVAFKQQGEDYIGILKKDKNKWKLEGIKKSDETSQGTIGELLSSITNDEICEENIGRSFEIGDLFETSNISFMGLIDDQVYYCTIEDNSRVTEGEELEKEVLDFAQGDVTGDGSIDSIYLVGDTVFGEVSSYAENIELVIKKGLTNEMISVSLPDGVGYNGSLFLADFTGNQVDDILVTLFTGGSGSYIYATIYSLLDGNPQLIFDYTDFNDKYSGDVLYKDNYKIEVNTQKPPRTYVVDISQEDEEYLSNMYDEQGLLDQPTEGTISGLVSLNPLDYDKNRIYELSALQRIIGINNADTIGLVETFLRWQEDTGEFEPTMQYVSVAGKPTE